MIRAVSEILERYYYTVCPDTDGLKVLVILTAATADQVLPPHLRLPCISERCSLGEHVLLPVSAAGAEALMVDEDEVDPGPDAARWSPVNALE